MKWPVWVQTQQTAIGVLPLLRGEYVRLIKPRAQEDSSNVVHKQGFAEDTIGHQEEMHVASKIKTCYLRSCL